MNKYFLVGLCVILTMSGLSCTKFLEEKPSSLLVIPSTPEDLQALLDNYLEINYREISAGEISSDDYFLTDVDYLGITEDLRRIYTWQADNLFPKSDNDWSIAYYKVYVANIVLDKVDGLYNKGYSQSILDNIKGQALFVRANALFNLTTTFALPFAKGDAASSFGVPLRSTSAIDEVITRPNLIVTIDKIVADLELSASLLPNQPVHVLRASKPAAYGLLSRIYLYINNYDRSLQYADSCLSIKKELLSFNTPEIPNLNASYPFSANTLKYNNPEIIFATRIDVPIVLRAIRAKIDTNLISMYKDGDNRKKVYFKRGTGVNSAYYTFKGSLEGSQSLFNGIAVDEVYLNRAECLARLGHTAEAAEVLNKLLITRWDEGVAYQDYVFSDKTEAIDTVLIERRKSLVMRGLRWLDIKRLNAIGQNITLERFLNGNKQQLLPGDLRFAIAIPESIISVSSIPQNPR